LTTFWGYYVKQIIELISLINIELPSPVWLTPHLRDPQPEGERERELPLASSLIEPLIASDSLQTPIYYH